MSPNTYFYNRDEQSRQNLISEIRGLYAFIFNEIVQLYKFYYPNEKSLSTKAEDVRKLTRTLYERHDERSVQNMGVSGRTCVALHCENHQTESTVLCKV